MAEIDFSQLPKDGRRFEAMVCELLRAMDFPIIEEPATGVDGGRDILVERVIRDALGERRERVVVQCKHFAHSGKAVSESDLGVWTNALLRYRAHGYLLVVSTTVTENLNRAFIEFTKENTPRFAVFWSGEQLETLLNQHVLVRDTFFPPETPRVTKDLGKYGWGIVFPANTDPAPIKAALAPLLALRKHQVQSARGPGVYKEFTGSAGVLVGEASRHWLERHGVGLGTPNPRKVPFFLVLVGSPEFIDFEFQAHLEVQYYTGRIAFDDISDYSRYAQAVCEAEAPDFATTRKVTFIAPETDISTRISSEELVNNLATGLVERRSDWVVQSIKAGEATKDKFVEIFSVRDDSALIFVATHGLAFGAGAADQIPLQGALLTNDWPGFGVKVTREHYFSADDVPTTSDLRGKLVLFLDATALELLLRMSTTGCLPVRASLLRIRHSWQPSLRDCLPREFLL